MSRASRSGRCSLRTIAALVLVGASACGDGHDYHSPPSRRRPGGSIRSSGTAASSSPLVGDFGDSSAIALAPDGGILVAGLAVRSNTFIAMVRYTGS